MTQVNLNMNRSRSLQNIVWAAVPTVVTFCTLLYLEITNSWAALGVPHMTPDFADLRQITSTSECVLSDPLMNVFEVRCDPWNRPYNYASIWAKLFAAFGVNSGSTVLLGIFFIAMLSLALGIFTFIGNELGNKFIVSASAVAIGFSPPFLLAAERGNSDIVILFILALAALLITRAKGYISAALVALAFGLKLYPAGAVGLLWPFKRGRIPRLIIFILTSSIFGLMLIPELKFILSGTPHAVDTSFGIAITSSILNIANPFSTRGLIYNWAIFLGITLIYLLAGLLLKKAKPGIFEGRSATLKNTSIRESLFLMGTGVWLTSYAFGTSWDYRLIFLSPVIAALLSSPKNHLWTKVLGVLLILQMYLCYPSDVQDTIGNVLWIPLAPLLFVMLLRSFWAAREPSNRGI